MKIINLITLWVVGSCFLQNNTVIAIFIFVFFLATALTNKINPFYLMGIGIFGIIYLVTITYWTHTNYFQLIYDFLNRYLFFNLREIIANYFIKVQGETLGSFLNLILLNIKNANNYDVYYKLISLSVVYLIVVSGFHVNILCNLLGKIFFKLNKTRKVFKCLLAFFICYLNGFSAALIRITFAIFFSSFDKTKKHATNLSLITIGLIAPTAVTSIGICMSFLGARGIKVFNKFRDENKLYSSIFTSVFATLYIIPFIAMMNDGFSLWAPFLSLLFAPVFFLTYVVSLFFGWFSFSIPAIHFFYNLIYQACNLLNTVNVLVPITLFQNYWIFGSYYTVIELSLLIYYKLWEKNKWKLKKLQRLY
ncbi:MAG: ComEC/Rec2 family competence protein [Malacoplasma sp.]|nr:ComEC/Rec2 family competence protein [Malacoplasma sp.]